LHRPSGETETGRPVPGLAFRVGRAADNNLLRPASGESSLEPAFHGCKQLCRIRGGGGLSAAAGNAGYRLGNWRALPRCAQYWCATAAAEMPVGVPDSSTSPRPHGFIQVCATPLLMLAQGETRGDRRLSPIKAHTAGSGSQARPSVQSICAAGRSAVSQVAMRQGGGAIPAPRPKLDWGAQSV